MQPDERRSLPMAIEIEASNADDSIPCDECEDPEGCLDQGYCELGLVDAQAEIDLIASQNEGGS